MANELRMFTELFSNFCIALGNRVLIKTIGALPLVVEVVIDGDVYAHRGRYFL